LQRFFNREIKRFGELLGAQVPRVSSTAPVLVLMEGDLGAGKTTFVQELLSHWGYPSSKVQSPTFLKVLEYCVPGHGLCVHMDCYRIEDPSEFVKLGLENYLDAKFWFVEWPGALVSYLESNPTLTKLLGFGVCIRLDFNIDSQGSRFVNITSLEDVVPQK
jgi:tRNA threonylcarbamoyl adenosine modification protein YjeE